MTNLPFLFDSLSFPFLCFPFFQLTLSLSLPHSSGLLGAGEIVLPKKAMASSGSGQASPPYRPYRHLQTLRGHEGPVSYVKYSNDGTLLASASTDKTVILWSASVSFASLRLSSESPKSNSNSSGLLGMRWRRRLRDREAAGEKEAG